MQKKVLLVINSSWNLINFRRGLVKSLLAAGYEVIAVTPVDDYSSAITALGCRHVPVELKPHSRNVVFDLIYIASLLKIFLRERPSVALTYTIKPNLYASLVGAILRTPVLPNVAGLGLVFSTSNGFLSHVVRLLYRLSFKHSPKIFFQNGEDLKMFVDAALVQRNRAILLPGSGIDLDQIIPTPMPDGDSLVFLFAARLLKSKGIESFVEASRKLKEEGLPIRCIVFGPIVSTSDDAVSKEEVNAWEQEGVIEYGGMSNEIPTVMRQVHCVVLPTFYREGTPRVLLEAAASGRIIITTDTAGCRDVVEDQQSGFLCATRDAVDLAAKMRKVVRLNSAERVKFGMRARGIAEQKFDEAFVVDQYLSEITSIE